MKALFEGESLHAVPIFPRPQPQQVLPFLSRSMNLIESRGPSPKSKPQSTTNDIQ